MTYDQAKQEMGKTPVYFLELFLDRCVNEYGVLPCTASGPINLKCFNTLTTCQDTPNYDVGTSADAKVYRFSSLRIDEVQRNPSPLPEGDPPTFPTIMGVDFAPTRLDPGKSLGVRSTVRITLQDHPWTDVGVDPYLDERTVNFDNQGSFWGRLLARNEFKQNRTLLIHTGYLDENGLYDQSNFITRSYILNDIQGPDENGTIKITGKDPLKFADSERKQWPRQSQATLDADLNNSDLSFNITDLQGQIDAQFTAGQPWVRLDDEIMEIDSIMDNGGGSYTLTVVARGDNPSFYPEKTTADIHRADTTVQNCYLFDGERVDDIVFFLLNTGAGIDAFFLPTVDWDLFIDRRGLNNYFFSALIVEPLGIQKLLNEICLHNIMLWWDERAQEIKMDAIVPTTIKEGPYNDDQHILKGSVSVAEAPNERVSQVWVIFGDRNPVRDRDKIETYQVVDVSADLDAETPEEYGDSRVKQIFSRWLPITQGSIAGEIGGRYLIEYRRLKKVVTLSLDAKDDEQWTGDKILMQTRYIQDTFGLPKLDGYQILQASENLSPASITYTYVMQQAAQLLRIGVITPDEDPENPPNPFPDYSAASDSLQDQYAFIAYDHAPDPPGDLADPPGFNDGSVAYQIV